MVVRAEPLGIGALARAAVAAVGAGALRFGEHATEETVSEAFHGGGHAADIADVGAQAEDHAPIIRARARPDGCRWRHAGQR